MAEQPHTYHIHTATERTSERAIRDRETGKLTGKYTTNGYYVASDFVSKFITMCHWIGESKTLCTNSTHVFYLKFNSFSCEFYYRKGRYDLLLEFHFKEFLKCSGVAQHPKFYFQFSAAFSEMDFQTLNIIIQQYWKCFTEDD